MVGDEDPRPMSRTDWIISVVLVLALAALVMGTLLTEVR